MKSYKIDRIVLTENARYIEWCVSLLLASRVCLMRYILSVISICIFLKIMTLSDIHGHKTHVVSKACPALSVDRPTNTLHRNMTVTLQYIHNRNCNAFIVPKSSETKQC